MLRAEPRKRPARRGARVAAFALVCLAAARADAFPHIVRPGETLARIAERFYGQVELEQILVAANALDAPGGVPVVAGMRLEIPAASHHRVSAGETWQGLATTLLGDADRSDVLALANRSMPWLAPAAGQEIIVPYNLRYIAAQGDSTLTVAYRFLGERDRAWMLDKYNHMKSEPLRRGDLVLVPLVDLPLTDEGKAAAAAAGAMVRSEGGGLARDAQRRADSELPSLAADLRGGRYVDVVARGNRMLGYGELSQPQRAAIQRALTEAYAALDAGGLAQTACAAWRDAAPTASLDPVELSPKIVRVCAVRPASSGPPPGAPVAASAAPSTEAPDGGSPRRR